MSLAVTGIKSATNVFGFFTPNHAVSVSTSDQIFLVIYRAEDEVTAQANHENAHSNHWWQMDWVTCQVLSLESVNRGQPY